MTLFELLDPQKTPFGPLQPPNRALPGDPPQTAGVGPLGLPEVAKPPQVRRPLPEGRGFSVLGVSLLFGDYQFYAVNCLANGAPWNKCPIRGLRKLHLSNFLRPAPKQLFWGTLNRPRKDPQKDPKRALKGPYKVPIRGVLKSSSQKKTLHKAFCKDLPSPFFPNLRSPRMGPTPRFWGGYHF